MMQLKAILTLAIMAVTVTAKAPAAPKEDLTVQGRCNTALRECFEKPKVNGGDW